MCAREVEYPEEALCDGAKTEHGYNNRRQPDWFTESEENLKLLF